MGDFDLNAIQQESVSTQSPAKSKNIKSKIYITIFCILAVILLSGFYVIYTLKYRNREDDLTIGYSMKEHFMLVTLAQKLEYFDKKGLLIDVRKFKNEEEVLEALNEDKIDIAVVEDISMVANFSSSPDMRVISSVADSQTYYFAVDLKKGITDLQKLKGESIGVIESIKTDFWLETGWRGGGINKRDVTIKNIKASKLAEELADAKVSAIISWQPYVYETQNFEGSESEVMLIPAQVGKRSHALALTSQRYIDQNNKKLTEFLSSLLAAEDYNKTNKDAVTEILISDWGVERNYVDELNKDYNYELSLKRELKDLLREQYEWYKKSSYRNGNGDVQVEQVIHYGLLREIKPEAVEY